MKKIFIFIIFILFISCNIDEDNKWCHWKGSPIRTYEVTFQNEVDTLKANYFRVLNRDMIFYNDEYRVGFYHLGPKKVREKIKVKEIK